MNSFLYCQVVCEVDRTWSAIKAIPNYDDVVGKMIFQKLFHLSELSKNGIREDYVDGKNFQREAINFVNVLDIAISLLGPDMESTEELLLSVAEQQTKCGILLRQYPRMGDALLETLEAIFGPNFTDISKAAWKTVYAFFSNVMIQGARCSLCKVKTVSELTTELESIYGLLGLLKPDDSCQGRAHSSRLDSERTLRKKRNTKKNRVVPLP